MMPRFILKMLISCLLFTTFFSFSQNNVSTSIQEKEVKLIELLTQNLTDYRKLCSYIEENFVEPIRFDDGNYILPYHKFQRFLENNFIQTWLKFDKNKKYYELIYLERDRKIAYLQLSRNDTLLFEIKNKSLMKILLNGKNLDKSNILYFPLELYTYGSVCDFSGTTLDFYKQILDWVNIKKYKKIAQWLHSTNPEIAAFGYTGMYFLKRQGIKVRKKEWKRMDFLANWYIPLSICEGCEYSKNKLMKDIISKSELDNLYKSFIYNKKMMGKYKKSSIE